MDLYAGSFFMVSRLLQIAASIPGTTYQHRVLWGAGLLYC
jgi:hypothetical protein